MANEEKLFRPSRRGVLSAFAGIGFGAAFGTVTSEYAATTVTATDSVDEILLGAFESSFDNWQTDGDVALSRGTRDDSPVAVTEGEYALDGAVEGEPTPSPPSTPNYEFANHRQGREPNICNRLHTSLFSTPVPSTVGGFTRAKTR